MNKFFLLASSLIFLSSCSTMNSDFSCNTTAGDSCLTIEEVDAMTSFADPPKTRMWRPRPPANSRPKCRNCKTIYLPPWADNNGIKHPGRFVKEASA